MSTTVSAVDGAIFFDLDGTLVDTAPDMVGILQALQEDHGVEPVSYATGRSHVSNGVVGLLNLAFPGVDGDAREALRLEYLERYELSVCERSSVFDGLESLLQRLDDAAVPWGVVTNKPGFLTEQLLARLDLSRRSACAVSGDTLNVRKPDPGPLLHACELTGVRPDRSIYVGDAARDIEAGSAAGMRTVAAAYGYIVDGDNPDAWGADQVAANTKELAQIVLKAVNLAV